MKFSNSPSLLWPKRCQSINESGILSGFLVHLPVSDVYRFTQNEIHPESRGTGWIRIFFSFPASTARHALCWMTAFSGKSLAICKSCLEYLTRFVESTQNTNFRFLPISIGSMDLLYLPTTWMVHFYGKLVGKYTNRPMDPMGLESYRNSSFFVNGMFLLILFVLHLCQKNGQSWQLNSWPSSFAHAK